MMTTWNILDAQCTCSEADEEDPHDHEFRCELWDAPGMMDWERLFIWDPELKELTERVDIDIDHDADLEELWYGESKKVDAIVADWKKEAKEAEAKPLTCTHHWVKDHLLCLGCKVIRKSLDDPWEFDDHAKPPKYDTPQNKWYKPYDYNTSWTPKCRHWRQEVVLPSGLKVFCSSHMASADDKKATADVPIDFGLYMATSWMPENLGYVVAWKDYGLPVCDWSQVVFAAQHALDMAREGRHVELGCAGGHGRTGAMLAVIATVDGMDPKDVVKWVHENYCTEAIESADQEWFPQWVHAKINGLELPSVPEKPKPEPKKTEPKAEKSKVSPMKAATVQSPLPFSPQAQQQHGGAQSRSLERSTAKREDRPYKLNEMFAGLFGWL